jgi:hypothetical protein
VTVTVAVLAAAVTAQGPFPGTRVGPAVAAAPGRRLAAAWDHAGEYWSVGRRSSEVPSAAQPLGD